MALPRNTHGLAGWLRTRPCIGGIRTMHNRLQLPYPIEEGMGNFLSPEGLRMIAEEYQQGLLDRLNEEVKGEQYGLVVQLVSRGLNTSAPLGTPSQNKSVAQTVIDAAQDPDMVLTFNYASEALNNSFFLNSFVRSLR